MYAGGRKPLQTGGKDATSCVHQFKNQGFASLVFLEIKLGPQFLEIKLGPLNCSKVDLGNSVRTLTTRTAHEQN